jgi:hypothetical protein
MPKRDDSIIIEMMKTYRKMEKDKPEYAEALMIAISYMIKDTMERDERLKKIKRKDLSKVRELYIDKKMNYEQIAEKMNCGRRAVYKAIQSMGLIGLGGSRKNHKAKDANPLDVFVDSKHELFKKMCDMILNEHE